MPLTADMKTFDKLDSNWFELHGERNYRVRKPRPGELEELARKALPPGATLIGRLPSPADNVEWCVLVIRVDGKTTMRLLTLKKHRRCAAVPATHADGDSSRVRDF